MTYPNFVAGYIVDIAEKSQPLYLLLKRSKNTYLPGIWQMVTGKVLPNEPASQAVYREINEETGLKLKEIYNVDVTMFYDQIKKKIAFSANFCAYANKNNSIILSDNEHDSYQWCSFSEAFSILAFPSQKETLKFIHNHYVLQKANEANLINL